jgi:hypothetical protein
VVIVALIVLLVSAGLAIRYGLSVASSRDGLWNRLGGSLVAAIGVGALYMGVSLLRALF